MASKILFLFCTALLTHGECLTEKCSNYRPCELETGEALRHPEQLLSKKSQLQMTLRVQMSKVTVGGWLELWRRTYNGKIGGPTWRVRPGDAMTVNLINTLGPNRRHGTRDQLKLANSTNLYLHGLHVSPKSNDATVIVNPGQTKEYSYTIGCDHPPGTYWYHPHVHGSTTFQTLSGMAGMIVIEDVVSEKDEMNPGSVLSFSCPNHCDHEVHLMFQPTMLYKIGKDGFSFSRLQRQIRDDSAFRNREKIPGGSILEDWLISRVNNVQYFTTNGQVQPTIRLQAGKTMRFRMVNAGGFHILEIGVPSSERGDLCEVHEIALDGIYLQKPQKPRHGISILPQGGTMDWLIRCDKAGRYKIKSKPNLRVYPGLGRTTRFHGLLANMEVVDAPRAYAEASFVARFDEDIRTVLPASPSFMPNLMSATSRRIVGKFVVETCSNNILNRQKYKELHTPIRYHMPLDGVQEWSLLNVDPLNPHTLHLQGHAFQVIGYNEYKGPASVTTSEGTFLIDQNGKFCNCSIMNNQTQKIPSTLSLKKAGTLRSKYTPYIGEGYAPRGHWRNTIIMPPLSNITVRLLPRHFTGNIMLHSLDLLRGDFGMKMLIQVVAKGQFVERSDELPKNLPGTCRTEDYYPVASTPNTSLGRQTFEDFFTWLYNLKPVYKAKYGDQRYLSGLYAAYLNSLREEVTGGYHLESFFEWAASSIPGYKDLYGNQGYLKQLYSFYIARNASPRFERGE